MIAITPVSAGKVEVVGEQNDVSRYKSDKENQCRFELDSC